MQGQDLASGNLTAPVLFALQSKCGNELLDLIDSEFVEEGDLQRAIELVKAGGGVAAAKQLACEEADKVCLVCVILHVLHILFSAQHHACLPRPVHVFFCTDLPQPCQLPGPQVCTFLMINVACWP